MALSNLSELKAAIRRYAGGDQTEDELDEAIKVAETKMFANDVELLVIRPLEVRAQAAMTTSSRFLALPDLFLTMRRLKYVEDGDDREIKFRAPAALQERDQAGQPEFFTVSSQLEFERVPDDTYTIEMQYMAKMAVLNSTNTTNEVLTNYPDIYIQGCLWYTYESIDSEQELATYHEQQFYKAIRGANAERNAGAFGPTPIRRMMNQSLI